MRRMRLAATMTALLLITACGGEDADQATEPPTAVEAGGEDTDDAGADSGAEDEAARIIGEAVSGDREGRAFDADDDMIIQTVVTATDAVEAAWDGSTLVAHFDDGSVDEVMAGMPCSAIGAVIAADESAVLIYPDGGIGCENWRGAPSGGPSTSWAAGCGRGGAPRPSG